MEEDSITTASRSLSIVNVLFAAWLIISPYILSYGTVQAKWEQTIAGIVVGILAIAHYAAPRMHWTNRINALIGAWLIIAPFATGYQGAAAYWNEVIFGALVLVVSLWSISLHPAEQRRHGQHHAM
jgi:hypothetical protein